MNHELSNKIRDHLEAEVVEMVRETVRFFLDKRGSPTPKTLDFFTNGNLLRVEDAIASLERDREKITDGLDLDKRCIEVTRGMLERVRSTVRWLDSNPDFDLTVKRNLYQVVLLLPSPSECYNLIKLHALHTDLRNEMIESEGQEILDELFPIDKKGSGPKEGNSDPGSG